MATDLRSLIVETANSIGISPVDLATAISYETGGTFNPTQRGPTTKWGQHRGLIQFGEPQARQYGVDWNDPINSQLGAGKAVARYLTDAGVKPGMGMLDVYSAINAGGVGPQYHGRSDTAAGGAPGTVADKVSGQMGAHRQKAEALIMNPNERLGGDGMVARNFASQIAGQMSAPMFGSPNTEGGTGGLFGPSQSPLPANVAAYATDDDKKKSMLGRIGDALAAIPDAPNPLRGGLLGDARSSGDMLNKALAAPKLADYLFKKRMA